MYLTQHLHRAVQQTPEAIATVYGDRVRTHRESVERIARLAAALRSLGVAEGDRVGIYAHNSDHFHESLNAVWWIGGVVNALNTRWSAREIAHALRDSGTRVLVVDDAFAPAVPALRGLWDGLTTTVHCGDGPPAEGMLGYEDLIGGSDPVEDRRLGGDRLAGLFYTGGTTGFPKGVMLSHRNLLTSALGSQASFRFSVGGGRTLYCAPMFHLAALGGWLGQSVVGGSHQFVPPFEPGAVLAAVERHRPTGILLVPTMIQMLIDHPAARTADLSSIQRVVYGASVISETLLSRAVDTFPQAGFVQAYGMTELSPVATLLSPEDHHDRRRLRSAGRAASFTEVRAVDPEGAELPPGTVGEIAVRGDNVMLGYWGLPEESAQVLRDGWMYTGDAGYLDDAGYLYIVDRLKDMIITGGENVYSAEVENVIAQHPDVAACAVVGIPDPEWGERVHAVVVLRPGRTTTTDSIRAYAKTLIAGYKAPRSVEFRESLPVSAAGKVLKRDLRLRYMRQIGQPVD